MTVEPDCGFAAPSALLDAAFLDIRIPGPDGLSLAGRLLTLTTPPLVVFETGFAGHAVDAFRVEAVDYLLKPIEFGAVLETVRRLEHRLVGQAQYPLSRPQTRSEIASSSRTRARGASELLFPRRHCRALAAPAHLDPHRGRGVPNLLPAGDARAGSAGRPSCRSPATRSST